MYVQVVLIRKWKMEQEIEIKKTIKLNLEQKGNDIICYDLTTKH